MAAMFFANWDKLSNPYREYFIHAAYHISFGKAVLNEKICVEIDQSETRIAYGGHIYKRIGMKRVIYIEDVPLMLPTKFQLIWTRRFRAETYSNLPIKNKNCLWRPCLLMDQN